MKIKEVMERTGLTDRAIRHYIECGLLIPHSDDGYTGRKNYAFTREDVERLQMIKTLREAGFGIEQIRELLISRSVRSLVQERLAQLEREKQHSAHLIEVLQKADLDREVSTEELAIILSSNPVRSIEPEEIYAPTPVLSYGRPREERPFTMHSSWWRKVYGETTVELRDTVQGVIGKMRQQQREASIKYISAYSVVAGECDGRSFRCSEKGTFSLRNELDALGLRGKVYTLNGKTYIRFYEVYEPLWTVLLTILLIILFPLLTAGYLYNLLTGDVGEAVTDFLWDYSLFCNARSRKESLYDLREDMLRRIDAIRRWDE